MSTMSIDQVLAQMRLMSAQAATESKPIQPLQGSVDFGDLLKQSIDSVNETQLQAG